MKKLLITLLIPCCACTAMAQTKRRSQPLKRPSAATAAPVKLNNTLDSASYAFGLSMASSLKAGGLKSLNYDLLVKGLQSTFSGQPALLSQENAQQAIEKLFKSLSEAKYAAQLSEGRKFLEQNKTAPGVQTTASGLQYQVLSPGSGPKPSAGDRVKVNYRGTLLSGKQFDSSYDRNEPLVISIQNVIPGWTEGMQLMAEGAKYKFFIPYQLAYGERGAGPDITPYSTLIFEIELLKINPDEK